MLWCPKLQRCIHFYSGLLFYFIRLWSSYFYRLLCFFSIMLCSWLYVSLIVFAISFRWKIKVKGGSLDLRTTLFFVCLYTVQFIIIIIEKVLKAYQINNALYFFQIVFVSPCHDSSSWLKLPPPLSSVSTRKNSPAATPEFLIKIEHYGENKHRHSFTVYVFTNVSL